MSFDNCLIVLGNASASLEAEPFFCNDVVSFSYFFRLRSAIGSAVALRIFRSHRF